MTRNRRGDAPIILAGAFGQGNPGDEALLTAFHRALSDLPLVVASTDPADTERRHGLPAFASWSWRDVARRIGSCSGLVFCGGTVFKNLPRETGRPRWSLLRNALAVAALARAGGKPVCMTGVGAGDLSGGSSRALARHLARQADLLVLRDEASARALARIGVPTPLRVGSDAAWTLLDQVPAGRVERSDTVIVVPSRWATAAAPAMVDGWVSALQPLLSAGFTVRIQPWQCDRSGFDDRQCVAELADELDGDVAIIPPPDDLEDAAATFARARLVLSARFHALVAAGAAGTPFVAVAHENKLGAIAARLGQPTMAPGAAPAAVRAAVHDALSVAPPGQAAVRAEVAAAEEGFGLLRLVLTRGAASADNISGLRLEPAW